MQIIVEDEDGEVVKTYELPSKPKAARSKEDPTAAAVRQGVKRMGTWSGLGSKAQEENAEPSEVAASSSAEKPVRAPLNRLGSLSAWGFGGKNTEVADEENDEDDDRRIRFTIGGGAGRRLTKEDFLKEIQSLDPKARMEIVEDSDAPDVLKALARQDASTESAGSSRLLGSRSAYLTSSKGAAHTIAAGMARRNNVQIAEEVEEEDSDDYEERERSSRHRRTPATTRRVSKADSPSADKSESTAERNRRQQAMRGVEDVSPSNRGRVADRGESDEEPSGETFAEKKRREAALGVTQDDSDDDDTPRIPPPVAKSRGIRFAQSPVRGKR